MPDMRDARCRLTGLALDRSGEGYKALRAWVEPSQRLSSLTLSHARQSALMSARSTPGATLVRYWRSQTVQFFNLP